MSRNAKSRDAAAHWLQRLPDESMSEEEMHTWLRWYGESPENRQAFDDVQSFYARLRGISDRQRTLLRRALPPQDSAPPREARRRAVGGPRVLMALAACFAAAAVGWVVWRPTGKTASTMAYAAPASQYRTVELSDGSVMVLDAKARANVLYGPATRRLEILEGRAYFEVEPDAKRPFVVGAGDVSVTALGTAFSVRREPDQLSVTVTEGSVEVVRGRAFGGVAGLDVPAVADPTRVQRVRMRAGERATVAMDAEPVPFEPSAARAADRWSEGSIEFLNVPLGEVISIVNAKASRRITIEDPRLAEFNYSGTIFRERVDEWVAALPRVYPVRHVPLDDGTLALVSLGAERPN